MKNWNKLEYQTIESAGLKDNCISVNFENGDKVTMALKSLLPFVDGELLSKASEDNLIVSAYDINLVLPDGNKFFIPWDKIRVLTDKEYGRAMAEKADEQAKLVGSKIKQLREKKGLRGNDLAERSGISAQTISRLEKGHTDVSFTTLKKLLASMGYSLKDLAELDVETETEISEGYSYNTLLKKLTRLGINKSFLINKIIPTKIHKTLSSVHSEEPTLLLNEAVSYISEVFGWKISDIWNSKDLEVPQHAALSALYKMPTNINTEQVKAYSHYSHYLSKIVLKATSIKPKDFPLSTEDFLAQYFKHYKTLELESLVEFVWDLGIIILPLNDSGLFHGASWRIEDRFVIILKQQSAYHARWIFDLLHELYHVLDHLQDPEQNSIIEFEEISPSSRNNSLVEREANSFANMVLFNGKADVYAEEAIELAKWNISNLSPSVRKTAVKNNVRVDSLANYIAARLSSQNQNWWGHAAKLQKENPNPYDVISSVLQTKLNPKTLTSLENNLLNMAIAQ